MLEKRKVNVIESAMREGKRKRVKLPNNGDVFKKQTEKVRQSVI